MRRDGRREDDSQEVLTNVESAPTSNKSLLEPEVPDVQVESTCQHHWVIDRPAGPLSKGVCRLCGENREFQNYVEDSSWSNSDISLEQLSGSTRIPAGIDVRSSRNDTVTDEDA